MLIGEKLDGNRATVVCSDTLYYRRNRGITAGLFGNGGGFVVVPALLRCFLFTPPSEALVKVAIGTSLASIVVSSARSVMAHRAKGAVDFDILRSWSIWLILGVGGGVFIANNTSANGLTVVFAAGVLLYSVYFCFLSSSFVRV